MQIYISKNNQQLGPFEEQKVLEMLRNGQLSPNDLAFRQGATQWQPLRVLFPNMAQPFNPPPFQFNNQIQPPPVKSGSSNVLLFLLLGLGGFFLLGIIGLFGFVIYTSSSRKVTVANVSNTNVIANSNTATRTNSNTNTRVANQKELDDKLKDFAKLKPPAKLENSPTIKEKVLIVEQLDRESESTLKFSPSYTLSNYGLKSDQIATNLAEVETLIQIKCGKGKEVGKYGPRTAYYVAYSNICYVSIIDYKNSKTIANKTFVNANHPKTIPDTGYDFINEPPTADVEKYLSGLAKL